VRVSPKEITRNLTYKSHLISFFESIFFISSSRH